MGPKKNLTKRSLRSADNGPEKRPKRVVQNKTVDDSVGLSRQEEQELNKALYASLNDTRRSKSLPSLSGLDIDNAEFSVRVASGSNFTDKPSSSKGSHITLGKKRSLREGLPLAKRLLRTDSTGSSDNDNLNIDESSKDSVKSSSSSANGSKKKIHAQRKFAQGCSLPGTPTCSPMKASATPVKLLSRTPKTEDFLTFLCLRGSPALPPHLDFFNFSKEELPLRDDSPKMTASGRRKRIHESCLDENSSSSSGANDETSTPVAEKLPSAEKTKTSHSKRSAARASAGTMETARGIVSLRQGLQPKESNLVHEVASDNVFSSDENVSDNFEFDFRKTKDTCKHASPLPSLNPSHQKFTSAFTVQPLYSPHTNYVVLHGSNSNTCDQCSMHAENASSLDSIPHACPLINECNKPFDCRRETYLSSLASKSPLVSYNPSGECTTKKRCIRKKKSGFKCVDQMFDRDVRCSNACECPCSLSCADESFDGGFSRMQSIKSTHRRCRTCSSIQDGCTEGAAHVYNHTRKRVKKHKSKKLRHNFKGCSSCYCSNEKIPKLRIKITHGCASIVKTFKDDDLNNELEGESFKNTFCCDQNPNLDCQHTNNSGSSTCHLLSTIPNDFESNLNCSGKPMVVKFKSEGDVINSESSSADLSCETMSVHEQENVGKQIEPDNYVCFHQTYKNSICEANEDWDNFFSPRDVTAKQQNEYVAIYQDAKYEMFDQSQIHDVTNQSENENMSIVVKMLTSDGISETKPWSNCDIGSDVGEKLHSSVDNLLDDIIEVINRQDEYVSRDKKSLAPDCIVKDSFARDTTFKDYIIEVPKSKLGSDDFCFENKTVKKAEDDVKAQNPIEIEIDMNCANQLVFDLSLPKSELRWDNEDGCQNELSVCSSSSASKNVNGAGTEKDVLQNLASVLSQDIKLIAKSNSNPSDKRSPYCKDENCRDLSLQNVFDVCGHIESETSSVGAGCNLNETVRSEMKDELIDETTVLPKTWGSLSSGIVVHSYGSLCTGKGYRFVDGRMEECQFLRKEHCVPVRRDQKINQSLHDNTIMEPFPVAKDKIENLVVLQHWPSADRERNSNITMTYDYSKSSSMTRADSQEVESIRTEVADNFHQQMSVKLETRDLFEKSICEQQIKKPCPQNTFHQTSISESRRQDSITAAKDKELIEQSPKLKKGATCSLGAQELYFGLTNCNSDSKGSELCKGGVWQFSGQEHCIRMISNNGTDSGANPVADHNVPESFKDCVFSIACKDESSLPNISDACIDSEWCKEKQMVPSLASKENDFTRESCGDHFLLGVVDELKLQIAKLKKEMKRTRNVEEVDIKHTYDSHL